MQENYKIFKDKTGQICVNYKKIHIGYFNTELEAKNAYLDAKEKYHISYKK